MLTLDQERARQREKAKRWYAKPANRAQRLAYMKAHRLANIDDYRARHRLWRSGWTQEQFHAAWAAQAGRCAICAKKMLPLGRAGESVTADHNHANGRPRGLLCRVCNSRLAAIEDSAWQAKAQAYLAQHTPGGLA